VIVAVAVAADPLGWWTGRTTAASVNGSVTARFRNVLTITNPRIPSC
jgi:hypothetical protein